MIEVICREETYIYNAYHMIKAFYPSGEVTSRIEEKASNYIEIQFPEGDILDISKGNNKHETDLGLYRALSDRSGRTLAWGILLGVRPTKIAMQKLEEGMDAESFIRWFQKNYLVSEEKSKLAYEIAIREKALIEQLDLEDGYSLYVGIPFCPTVCTYCSFSSGALAAWKDRVEDYIDALCREIEFIAGACREKKLNTIYIGGGTPTTLSAGQLEQLLTCIDDCFSREHLLEYTIEAGRPDSITREKLEVIRRHKVTRISINPQTMQQKTLDVIGRKHTVEDIKAVFSMAREMGFDNINMDLIAGLPGESAKDMEDTLREIEKMGPDNLTVHSLCVKRAAKMGQKESKEHEEILKDRQREQKESPVGDMIQTAYEKAAKMELFPYYLYRQKNIAGNFENVGYAKVDKAGIYNILIMEEKQSIIAAGAGASTKIVLKQPVILPGSKKKKQTNLIRIENVKAIDAYISRIDEMIERKGEWLWR